MNWLLDATDFLTRSHCGPGWTPWLSAIDQVSNLVIFCSFISIPLSIHYLYLKKKHDIPTPHIFWLLIIFILLCGLIHLNEVLVFHWAPYRLFTFVTALTAVASLITACRLPIAVRTLAKLSSREYVHKINNQLQNEVLLRIVAEQELAVRNEKLFARVKTLEDMLNKNAMQTLEDLLRLNAWIHERNRATEELNHILEDLETI